MYYQSSSLATLTHSIRSMDNGEYRYKAGGKIYLLNQRFNSLPLRIFFALGRGTWGEREIELFGRGALNVGVQVGEIGGGLEVDAAVVVGRHCFFGVVDGG